MDGGDTMKLKGKVVLITGGGTGIGAAVTERFVNEGAKVCICARRQEMLEKVAQSFPSGKVEICAGDVSKLEDTERMVETAVKFGGKLDVLVNNAGISIQGPVGELDPEDWRKVIDVNLSGPFFLMRAAIPYMIKAGGGSIINVASVGGLNCLPGFPAYCTSKAGLIMLTKQAALDYGPMNIRCNVICPGGVKTAMTEEEFGQFGKMLGMDSEKFFSLISKEIPLQRFADPHEMGGICTLLASDESSFMTGSSIVVDGGTDVVDVVGASMIGAMRRGGVIPE
jgi:meso-butanediol dehydrogenase/(S,S)-butanediol dehydrogenase/diacetyl reductase